jgi:hypothetical protein
LKAVFRHGTRRAILHAGVQLRTDESNNDVVIDSDQHWYAKDFGGSARRVQAPLWLLQNSIFSPLRSPFNDQRRFRYRGRQLELPGRLFRSAFVAIGALIRDLKYYSASQFTNPSLCPVSFEVQQEGPRQGGIRLRGHRRFLYDLYKERETDSYKQFLQVIGSQGIGLVDDITFKAIPTSSIEYQVRSGGEIQQRTQEKILVVPQFVIGTSVLSPNQLSEGTFKTITLLFYLITEKSTALLIEEPEVCVHHGLLKSIVELIKIYSKQKQIILSTHSDFVLDQIEARHVYRVSRLADVGTVVTHVTKAMSRRESIALKEYLETEGNLGEYWRHGGFD